MPVHRCSFPELSPSQKKYILSIQSREEAAQKTVIKNANFTRLLKVVSLENIDDCELSELFFFSCI